MSLVAPCRARPADSCVTIISFAALHFSVHLRHGYECFCKINSEIQSNLYVNLNPMHRAPAGIKVTDLMFTIVSEMSALIDPMFTGGTSDGSYCGFLI